MLYHSEWARSRMELICLIHWRVLLVTWSCVLVSKRKRKKKREEKKKKMWTSRKKMQKVPYVFVLHRKQERLRQGWGWVVERNAQEGGNQGNRTKRRGGTQQLNCSLLRWQSINRRNKKRQWSLLAGQNTKATIRCRCRRRRRRIQLNFLSLSLSVYRFDQLELV